MSSIEPLVIHGWKIFAHPLFLHQLAELNAKVEQLRHKYPQDYTKKNATKRLAAIAKLAQVETIPIPAPDNVRLQPVYPVK